MWSTILPELMSIVVVILTILCIEAGSSASVLQGYPILSFNTTGLQASYHNITNVTLPIHDVYNLYMTTSCKGNYVNGPKPLLLDVSCSAPSSYFKFLPADQISTDLMANGSNVDITSLNLPPQIQDMFKKRFNLQLHVAFIFYIMSAANTCLAVLWGTYAFWNGFWGIISVFFTSVASVCLLISCVIVTTVQSQGVGVINDYGNSIGLSAYTDNAFLSLTWWAFALSTVSVVEWFAAALLSAWYRDTI